jgi:hypothetical protein
MAHPGKLDRIWDTGAGLRARPDRVDHSNNDMILKITG